MPMPTSRSTLGKLKLRELTASGKVTFDGNRDKFRELLALFDKFDFWFTISEP